MLLKSVRFLVLLFAALGLGPGTAHVLELAPRMTYDPQLYATVTSTLYRWFGSVGAAFQIGAVLAAMLLTWLVRHHATFRLTLSGWLALVLSLILWGVLVAPVNAEWLEVMNTTPDAVPAAYARLRERWEYGHVAAFTAWLVGYSLLVLSEMTDGSGTQRSPKS